MSTIALSAIIVVTLFFLTIFLFLSFRKRGIEILKSEIKDERFRASVKVNYPIGEPEYMNFMCSASHNQVIAACSLHGPNMEQALGNEYYRLRYLEAVARQEQGWIT